MSEEEIKNFDFLTKDEKLKTLQLALYRLAYSRFTGIPIENIEVSFYFVAEDKEIRPTQIPNEQEDRKSVV